MLKVGITGGIGSGKSVVCRVFTTLGIPVLYADDTARYLMENDATLIYSIKLLFGDDIYNNGKLDREQASSIVFTHPEKLQQLNSLVHPATVAYSQQWIKNQNSPYIIKEAAIFFESGTYKDMDVMVGVYAPVELRIGRIEQRSHLTREQITARMSQQMDEDEKMKRCDYVIKNDEVQGILPQVLALHKELLQR